ncbi:MAG: chemotaxis protein CheW [Pseudomonadota bacterium]
MLATTETSTQFDAPNLPQSTADLAGTYLTFDLAGQILGVEVRNVREILDRATIRQIPNAPHDIEGIVDIRGKSIPIIDMGSRLALPRSEDGEDTRIIVFEFDQGGDVRPTGVIADRVRNVAQVGPEAIEAPPKIAGSDSRSSVLRGVARQDESVILLLDISQILGEDDFDFGSTYN